MWVAPAAAVGETAAEQQAVGSVAAPVAEAERARSKTYYDVLVEGTLAHNEARHEEAAAIYRSVLEAVPSYSDAYHLYAIAMLDLGRREEALAYAARAVEMSPLDANFYNSLGEVLRRNGSSSDVQRAAEMFRRSLQLNPSSASVANNLGACHPFDHRQHLPQHWAWH